MVLEGDERAPSQEQGREAVEEGEQVSAQMQLGGIEPAKHRVDALANVLAGFRYPGRRSVDKLTKAQRANVEAAARDALTAIAAGPDT